MTRSEIIGQIKVKQSFLCVGLDTDLRKIPAHLLVEKDPIFEFNKQIIDATYKYTVAYKPNIAFYEAMGPSGWDSLQKTIDYLPKDCFSIADAKRGDIGNTSALYAKTFFDPSAAGLNFDSVTVAPYMGSDSVLPFLEYPSKWVILLALTSNTGANDFQFGEDTNGQALFKKVLKQSATWGTAQNMMYVVGATKASLMQDIRAIVPSHFLLVPGVGAQGGSLSEVAKNGLNSDCGLLVNASRSIIYANNSRSFAAAAAAEAKNIQTEMAGYLQLYC
jgi:orotidine-5'-phosphate decarboxylase